MPLLLPPFIISNHLKLNACDFVESIPLLLSTMKLPEMEARDTELLQNHEAAAEGAQFIFCAWGNSL